MKRIETMEDVGRNATAAQAHNGEEQGHPGDGDLLREEIDQIKE